MLNSSYDALSIDSRHLSLYLKCCVGYGFAGGVVAARDRDADQASPIRLVQGRLISGDAEGRREGFEVADESAVGAPKHEPMVL